MTTWVVILVFVIATLSQGMAATNSTSIYGDLPTGNYTAGTVDGANTGSLSHLFNMAQGFVNVVFRPFSELETFIRTVFESSDGALTYLAANWQDAASFEAGYIACLVFGVLFFVFVPIVGSIMACCRCCGNCGGRLKQSSKRSKSCWRQCLCVTMLILTTFMAIPTVFVFLTNEWVTDVVDTAPAKTVAILNDVSEYLNLVPKQVTYMTDQYTAVDDNVRPLVSDFGTSIGEPLKVEIMEEASTSLQALDDTIKVVDAVTVAINDVDTSVTALKTGTTIVSNSLDAVKTNLNSLTCTASDVACVGVRDGTDELGLGFDPNDFDDLLTELDSVNTSINGYDLNQLQTDINNEINNIPQKVTDETKSASDSAVSTLDSTNDTISEVSDKISSQNFEEIDNSIKNLQDTITNAMKTYDDKFDYYRYIAGCVLGAILAFVVFCYYLGMVLGICGHRRKIPSTERSAASNCGGIMIMVGVGFSFIFSWLLMILVIITFTIGGHGERYGCQAMDPPNYEAVELAANLSNLDLAKTLGLPADVSLGFSDIMTSCENDDSAYQAFKLEYVFNITEFISNVTRETTTIDDKVNSTVDDIDFASIKIYSTEDQKQLLDLKNSGLDGINFTDYLEKLGTGITKTNLTLYAQGLRTSADNFNDPTSTEANIVRAQADEVDRIQADEVEPLQGYYDTLEASINKLISESMMVNNTIDVLDDSLTNLNASVTQNGAALVTPIVESVTDQVINNITGYTDWIADQLTNTLGACRPVYNTYTGFVALFCDYLIDTINGLWFSLGWCVFFLIPSAIVGMKLMKFFRRMDVEEEFEDAWDDMEMRDYAGPAGGNKMNNAHYY